MRLVNFSEIYQLREENRTTDISAIGYIYGWCANMGQKSDFLHPLYCGDFIKLLCGKIRIRQISWGQYRLGLSYLLFCC